MSLIFMDNLATELRRDLISIENRFMPMWMRKDHAVCHSKPLVPIVNPIWCQKILSLVCAYILTSRIIERHSQTFKDEKEKKSALGSETGLMKL